MLTIITPQGRFEYTGGREITAVSVFRCTRPHRRRPPGGHHATLEVKVGHYFARFHYHKNPMSFDNCGELVGIYGTDGKPQPAPFKKENYHKTVMEALQLVVEKMVVANAATVGVRSGVIHDSFKPIVSISLENEEAAKVRNALTAMQASYWGRRHRAKV